MTKIEHSSQSRHTPDTDLPAVVASIRRVLTNSDKFRYSRERDIAQTYETIDLEVLGVVGITKEER